MADLRAQLTLESSKYEATLRSAEQRVKQFSARLEKEGGGLGDKIFGKLGGAMGSLLPAASFAGAVTGMKSILNSMDDIADGAAKLGMSAEEFQRLGQVAEIVGGTNIEAVTSALLRLQRQLEAEPTDKLTTSLEQLGVSAEDLARMTPSQQMVALSDAFNQARQTGAGLNEMTNLMGKNYTELIPLLRAGGNAITEELGKVAVVQESVVQGSAALNDALDRLVKNEVSKFKEFVAVGALVAKGLFSGKNEIGKAQADGENKAADQQKERDAAAQRVKDNQAEAKAKQEAADAKKRQEELDRISLEIAREQEALEQKKFQAGLEQLSLGNQQIQIQQRIKAIQEELINLPMHEADKLRLQQEIVDWQQKEISVQGQIANEKAKTAQEQERAAEKAREQAEREADQMKELDRLQKEMEVTRARAAGDTKKAEQLQKEIDIAAEAERIASATGISLEKALRIAQQKQQIEEFATDRESKRAGGKIFGYSHIRQGGAGASRGFTGLDGFYDLQGSRLRDSFQFPSLDAARGGPMAGRAMVAGTGGHTPSKDEKTESLLSELIQAVKELGG